MRIWYKKLLRMLPNDEGQPCWMCNKTATNTMELREMDWDEDGDSLSDLEYSPVCRSCYQQHSAREEL